MCLSVNFSGNNSGNIHWCQACFNMLIYLETVKCIAGNRIVGSNPPLSAIFKWFKYNDLHKRKSGLCPNCAQQGVEVGLKSNLKVST
jgi:hypothetical protein